jgi:hypothetical protein
MMTTEELEALERVIAYVLCNEEANYEEYLQEGDGEAQDHVYAQALILDDYIKGLYSTGSNQ